MGEEKEEMVAAMVGPVVDVEAKAEEMVEQMAEEAKAEAERRVALVAAREREAAARANTSVRTQTLCVPEVGTRSCSTPQASVQSRSTGTRNWKKGRRSCQ